MDDLVDVIEGSRVYIPAIYVVNKIDQITLEELEVMDKLPHYCPVRPGWMGAALHCAGAVCGARGRGCRVERALAR